MLLALVSALACQSGPRTPHESLKPLWLDYLKLPAVKAMAVAGDPERFWVAAAAGGHTTSREAQKAALDECAAKRAERRMQAPCRIYAVGSRIVW